MLSVLGASTKTLDRYIEPPAPRVYTYIRLALTILHINNWKESLIFHPRCHHDFEMFLLIDRGRHSTWVIFGFQDEDPTTFRPVPTSTSAEDSRRIRLTKQEPWVRQHLLLPASLFVFFFTAHQTPGELTQTKQWQTLWTWYIEVFQYQLQSPSPWHDTSSTVRKPRLSSIHTLRFGCKAGRARQGEIAAKVFQ